jgi:hypothetical protein
VHAIVYHTKLTGDGDLRAAVGMQKLCCIVRKLPPKRKLNSSANAALGIDRGLEGFTRAARLPPLRY